MSEKPFWIDGAAVKTLVSLALGVMKWGTSWVVWIVNGASGIASQGKRRLLPLARWLESWICANCKTLLVSTQRWSALPQAALVVACRTISTGAQISL
jgi:hypothetical protein